MLINQHYSLSGSRPYVANVVEVGGLQLGQIKPLPQVGWARACVWSEVIFHLINRLASATTTRRVQRGRYLHQLGIYG